MIDLENDCINYLDFIFGNTALLKADILPIMRRIFQIEVDSDWEKISKPVQLIIQVLSREIAPMKFCCLR